MNKNITNVVFHNADYAYCKSLSERKIGYESLTVRFVLSSCKIRSSITQSYRCT